MQTHTNSINENSHAISRSSTAEHMQLKFPNARLYVYSLLSAEGLSAAEAIATAATHFGLIDGSDYSNYLPSSSPVPCACMETAEKIIRKVLEVPGHSTLQPLLVEQVWLAVTQEFSRYESKGTQSAKHHNCTKFAPVLFDLLLQQIRRYT